MSRVIVHISDVHFGRTDPLVVDPLIAAVHAAKPDVVAISGDLTQRARVEEFEAARQFLDRLPAKHIVIPGNHDVPLYNLYHRFARGFDRYRKYIAHELEPSYVDDRVAVVSINTTRSLTWKGGRVGHAQAARVKTLLKELASDVIKIVVTHHPFELPEGFGVSELVGRSRMAMGHLAECDADVLLAGHLHVAHVTSTVRRYRIHGHSALIVQAGTAASSRRRGEQNSFNVLRVAKSAIRVERWTWRPDDLKFACASAEKFVKKVHGWVPEAEQEG